MNSYAFIWEETIETARRLRDTITETLLLWRDENGKDEKRWCHWSARLTRAIKVVPDIAAELATCRLRSEFRPLVCPSCGRTPSDDFFCSRLQRPSHTDSKCPERERNCSCKAVLASDVVCDECGACRATKSDEGRVRRDSLALEFPAVSHDVQQD